jgi:hypothetical protein
MECTKCGTWNPDDKVRCWRCSAELPKPPEPSKSKKINSQTWMWVLVVAFIVVTTLFRCNAFDMGGGEGTGFLSPSSAPSQSLQQLGWVAVSSRAQFEPAPWSTLPISAGYSTMDGTCWVGS